jgi:hypothetical protein
MYPRIITAAVDAAIELHGELWLRLRSAADNPSVASPRLTADPVARGAAGPRAPVSHSLGLLLELHTGARSLARRAAASVDAPEPLLGTSDASTRRALTVVAELLPEVVDEALLAEACGWLRGIRDAARRATGTAPRVAPQLAPVRTAATAAIRCGACGSRDLVLEEDWHERPAPRLLCRCGQRIALGDAVPAALPALHAATTVTLPEVLDAHPGIAKASLYRWARALTPTGTRAGHRTYARAEVDALLAQRGRTAAIRPAEAVAA